ncbi:hypothetical protein [Oceaniglobus indicus]|uniref:hypothetical protein n=1 Tax=Oceaniglobus indicus TaxID=2047749 RepID=UPI000C1884CD|nr:hypothetical protein [Oceaniglobus indicus]
MQRISALFDYRKARSYLILSWAAVALSVVVGYFDAQKAAERKMAIRGGPPPVIQIQDFQPANDITRIGEVNAVAQIDVSLPILALYGDGVEQRRAVVFPLVATDVADPATGAAPPVLGYAYFDAPRRNIEVFDPSTFIPKFSRIGSVGPIVTLNGLTDGPAALRSEVSDLLASMNRPLTGPALSIAPFGAHRADVLGAMRPSMWRLGFLGLAALLLLGALVRFVVRHRMARDRAGDMAEGGRDVTPGLPRKPTGAKGRRRLAPLTPQPELTDDAGADAKTGRETLAERVRVTVQGTRKRLNRPEPTQTGDQKSGVTPGRRNSLIRSRNS